MRFNYGIDFVLFVQQVFTIPVNKSMCQLHFINEWQA